MKRLFFLLVFLLFSHANADGLDLPQVKLSLGFYSIEVEVAATQEARMQGLMGRKSLGEYNGMLFIFPEAQRHCMWMKNTLIPLSVAFLDDTGRIISIHEMEALSEKNHCAAAPTRFALEMGGGWFNKKGFKTGDTVRLPREMMRGAAHDN